MPTPSLSVSRRVPEARPRPAFPDGGLALASTDLFGSPLALAIMLTLAWLLPAGPFTAVGLIVLGTNIALSPSIVNSTSLRLVLPFLIMAAWGAAMGLGHDKYDLLKDFWYALKVALCLVLGFAIGIRTLNSRAPLAGFVWFAFASALWSIGTWAYRGGGSLDTIGLEGFEHISLASVAALPLCYWGASRERGARQAISIGVGAVIIIAILLSASRTTIGVAAIMILAMTGLLSSWRRMLIAAVIVAAVMYVAYQLLPDYAGTGNISLAAKFRHSLDEILLTDNSDPSQIMMNWRGFEAYNAQLLFDQSTFIRKLLGNGFGTTVDLGIEINNPEDGTIVRFQAILHNGYYYLLVKYGVLGLFTYVGTLLWYARIGRRTRSFSASEDKLLNGLIGAILFATLVITGLYNKSALQDMTILLGWLIGQGCRHRFDQAGSSSPAVQVQPQAPTRFA
jgi:O-antigen ligase